MIISDKTCTKCGGEYPATLKFFYKHTASRGGLTPRCKECVNEDNRKVHLRRLKRDPEKVRAQASKRNKRHYRKDIRKSRKKSRESAARARADPDRRAVINARKRACGAGLSPEEIEQIRENQNGVCAICSEPDPTDLDHCHETGRVRWLLCRHCNRGLGAFRDNPEFLEKAAALLRTMK